MDKLKAVIKEYGRWSELDTYIDRIETHIEIDFSHSLENAKALLETVGKEICTCNDVELGATPSINSVLIKKTETSSTVSIKNFLVSKSTLLLRCLISSNDLPCEVKPSQ
jgi:cob(I)alamin adenosyltransferase